MPTTTRREGPRRRFPAEILSPKDIGLLMDACGEGAWTAARNRALIAVLYRSGLRIGEAVALEPKDIDLDAGTIRVLRGKGGRARTVGIDPAWGEVVGAWLAVRARLGHGPRGAVFVSRGRAAMTPAHCRRLLAQFGRRAGIERRVHPHGLRHTHAAELREEGVDVGVISKQLGHRSIATTARYLDHIAPQDVILAISRRHGPTPPSPHTQEF